MIPLAGLASETGDLLGEYRSTSVTAIHASYSRRRWPRRSGMLWYVADVAIQLTWTLPRWPNRI